MNRLSATIITRDEERDLPRVLASLAGLADEVVVVDSGSVDRTGEIARAAGARVIVREWTGYSDQKNFAAGQAAHDWILSLDADEELSPALRESLERWKQTEPAAAAYSVPRWANYLGAWINHGGWYPDPKIRLYRRDRARFVGALHETVQTDGPVDTSTLRGDLYHYTVRTFSEHVSRVNRYTSIAAGQLFAQKLCNWLFPMLVSPPWTFLHTYLFQQGFRDGYRGWLIAQMAAYYVFLKYLKLGILVHGGSLSPETVKPREVKP